MRLFSIAAHHENMLRMKKVVFGVGLGCIVLGVAFLNTRCSDKSVGDADVERNFQGDWACEYFLTNDSMRMKVTEVCNFDTLTHKYHVEQVQEIIYPVHLHYANVVYDGDWTADEKFLHGIIDQSTVANELNPQFDKEPATGIYKELVKHTADADMRSDIYLIRNIEGGRIHLYDDDRKVAHDLIRKGTKQQ